MSGDSGKLPKGGLKVIAAKTGEIKKGRLGKEGKINTGKGPQTALLCIGRPVFRQRKKLPEKKTKKNLS